MFPASAALSPLFFPLIDRDGLSKPLLQIIAEDAIGSGIEKIGVLASKAVQIQFRATFDRWQGPAQMPEDWILLQKEKLATVAATLEFIDSPAASAGRVVDSCRAFVGNEAFAFIPADVLYVSETKDRCLEQLLTAAASHEVDCVLAAGSIMEREAYTATVLYAGGCDRFSLISEVVERPTLEQLKILHTPGLPPGQYLAATGMCVLSSAIFSNADAPTSLWAVINAACKRGRAFATPVAAVSFDLQTPYGFLEAQLGLGLAGIHRVEICEMIARTLAAQAKY